MKEVRCAEDIAETVRKLGFLPFFANGVRGWSVEELCPAELWFSDTVDGPWEWKGPVARGKTCVYGKFFAGKAGFVDRAWLADFANYRRDGYDFDARWDDGLAPAKDKAVYDTVAERGPLLSKDLKRLCNYRKGGNRGFETVITRLQMQTYLVVSDFVYMRDASGKPYGWGVAQYAAPEALLGADAVRAAYRTDPSESYGKILEHLRTVLPAADETALRTLLRAR